MNRMPISTTTKRGLSALLCVAALSLSSPVSLAGDNDGGLDLPGPHGAGPDSGGGGGSSASDSGSPGNGSGAIAETQLLLVSDDFIDDDLREDAGTLLIEDAAISEQAEIGSSGPTNDLQLGGIDPAADQLSDGVALQGSTQLSGPLAAASSLLPPAAMTAGAALIVIDHDADADLEGLLAGQVALDSWHLTGVPDALDVSHFAGLAAKLGPGLHVSFVIASLDQGGGLHLAAVRVDTTDGSVEFSSH